MAEKTFKLKWKDCLGRDWMNKYNLEACLFSSEHIKVGGLTVEDVKKHNPDPEIKRPEPFVLYYHSGPRKVSWWWRVLRLWGVVREKRG